MNWLGNVIACVSLPTVVLTPILANRYGVKRCVRSVSRPCGHGTSSHLARTVRRCCSPTPSIGMGPLRWNGAVVVQGWRLRPHHYWPGEKSTWELYSLPFVSYFLQALSGVSQAIFRILVTKYSERWVDPKGRTIATMVLFIGTGPFLRKGIPTTDSTSFQPILPEVCWLRCCHPHSRIRASRCVRIQSVTVVRMSTCHATSKILALAVISTVVAPIDFLVLEAPSTPSCRDLSSSSWFRRLNSLFFQHMLALAYRSYRYARFTKL